MIESSALFPVLKSHDWEHRDKVLCYQLATHLSIPYMPWITFGQELSTTFCFHFAKQDQNQTYLMEEALHNLRKRPALWNMEDCILQCSNDCLAAERILDSEFMQKGYDLLNTDLLAVGIPCRGLLLAINGRDKENIGAFAVMVSTEFFRAYSSPITPITFMFFNGKIAGYVQGLEESGRQIVERENQECGVFVEIRYMTSEESGKDAIHILAGASDLEILKHAIETAFIETLNERTRQKDANCTFCLMISRDITPYTLDFQTSLQQLLKYLQEATEDMGVIKRFPEFCLTLDWY
jgi:hypothetical protein